MLSARAGAEAVDEGFAGGADDYLPKPFRSQELVDRVASRLSAVTRERERQRREAQLDLVHLDSALQATDSVAGILDALVDYPFGAGVKRRICVEWRSARLNHRLSLPAGRHPRHRT